MNPTPTIKPRQKTNRRGLARIGVDTEVHPYKVD